MLTWSTSTTSLNPNGNRNGKSETRVGEEFLKTWDDAVFDGKHPLPVSQSLSTMNHSKSADYVREKISNGSTTAHLKSTLPKIVDSKRLLRK
ncbi:CRE-XBX-4 protein [Caenorhabditis remanei]|uniref:CRE-XBX-4 protein n=1 Tax=Caenorhabditis remanei TaxID=31234 RepID=E3N5Y2_CAERE|nr:CRE-XBX-4 protein [Caenorhabditis remanei]